jgi:pimeloyl-ACP methyl ester carboxylesterase
MKTIANATTLARFVVLGAVASMVTVASVGQSQQTAAPRKAVGTRKGAAGHYASVNGLKMYYESHGSGRGAARPLVLLHGAFSRIETDFGMLIPTFAKTRKVIAVEQQAHGHTGDIDRPLTYEQMADDTAELLRQVQIENADFLGYSMGGGIATQIAIRHPELVHKFVFAGGTSYNAAGYYPEMIEGEKTMTADAFAGTPWKAGYDSVAPNPASFPALVAKIKDLDVNWVGWKPEEVQAIKAPALLIIGDADIVRPEHTVEMFRLLGGGVAGDLHPMPSAQLAILPGTTHVTLITRTDWLRSMVTAFLDAPPPHATK